MKCQSCGKREATIKYYENINGEKQQLNFCMECAKKFGVTDFNNLFSSMFLSMPSHKIVEELSCPNCGYRLQDYTRTGLFGCPTCYDTFETSLDDLFYKIHGKNKHVKLEEKKSSLNQKHGANKLPTKAVKLESLKEKLSQLVKSEAYEEAAIIRDEIKKIEGK